ncbi:MAG TPA: hypothetical protein VH640_16625, partial [Bryobacteraceae bacterium]
MSAISEPLDAQVFAPIGPLSFVKPFAGADPLPQTVTVASVGAGFNFTVAASTNTGGSWLAVGDFFGCSGGPLCSTPHTFTARVTTTAAMAVATYTGQIVLTSQFNGIKLTIPVTLTVTASGSAFFDNMPGQMSFSIKTGGQTPPSQSVQVRNGGAGSLNWTLSHSTSDGGAWLDVSSASGTAPSIVTVSVNKANLPGGGVTQGSFIGHLVFQSATGN